MNLNHGLIPLKDDFLEHLKTSGKSTNTLKNYRTDLDCFKDFLINGQNNLNLTNFSIQKVMEYGSYLDRKYSSDNSRRRRVQTVRIFFDYLVKKNIFTENPMKKLPTSPKFVDIPRPTPLFEVRTLWEYLYRSGKELKGLDKLSTVRNQLIVVLVYGCGLKVAEISNLLMSDLLMSKDQLRILVRPERRDAYSITIPFEYYPIVHEYLNFLTKQKDLQGLEFDQLLFNANSYRILAGGLSARGLEIIFEEFRKKLKINITPKSLRQSCVFKWLTQKHGETEIKEWMGVAPSYSLKPYIDLISEHPFCEMQAIEQMI